MTACHCVTNGDSTHCVKKILAVLPEEWFQLKTRVLLNVTLNPLSKKWTLITRTLWLWPDSEHARCPNCKHTAVRSKVVELIRKMFSRRSLATLLSMACTYVRRINVDGKSIIRANRKDQTDSVKVQQRAGLHCNLRDVS